jgi:hypothetical protein
MSQEPHYAAFISYAGADRARAEDICAHLEDHGLRCWIAPRDVRGGREYASEILVGIERSAALVLVLSAAANESQFVPREVERAVAKGRPLIPVRVEEVLPASGLELFVSATHWIDAWAGDREAQLDRVYAAVRDAVPDAPPARPRPAPSPGQAPPSARRPGNVAPVAAVLLVVAALAGLGYRYASGEASRRSAQPANTGSAAPQVTPPADAPEGGVADAPAPAVPRDRASSDRARTNGARLPAPRQDAPANPGSDADRLPSTEPMAAAPAVTPVSRSAAADDLRYRATLIGARLEAVDGSLLRLAEQMRPNGLRSDIVRRQRSAAASLQNATAAIDGGSLDLAEKYLAVARIDVEALEEFLGR